MTVSTEELYDEIRLFILDTFEKGGKAEEAFTTIANHMINYISTHSDTITQEGVTVLRTMNEGLVCAVIGNLGWKNYADVLFELNAATTHREHVELGSVAVR